LAFWPRAALRGEAERLGVELGEPSYDDDGFEEKLALARDERVPVVAYTFGCPDAPARRDQPDRPIMRSKLYVSVSPRTRSPDRSRSSCSGGRAALS